jgi:hemolysin activation/secretion protein
MREIFDCEFATRCRLPIVCFVAALAWGAPVRAQFAPGSAAQVPQGSPIPRILPPAPLEVAPRLETPTPSQTESEAPNVPVRIAGVTVNGATAYPQAELATLTAGLVGPAVPLPRVEAARQSILALYRRDGYVLTTVAASVDAHNQLRFTITEGYIADVKLEGDIGPAGTQVLRFLHHLTKTRPIDALTLERWLLLAQDVPGISVRAVLRPSTEEPGALTLVAQVSRQALSGLFTSDNRGFRQTGPEQFLSVLDANSFTSLGERTELSIYHTYNNTQTFGQAASEFFIGGSGLRLRLYSGAGPAIPSGDLRAAGYDGFTTIFGAQATYPLIRSRAQTLNIYGAFDGLETNIKELGGAGPDGRVSFDSLRILRAGADYALEDLLLGGDRTGVNSASLRLSKGLHILGATSNDEPDPGRVGEKTDFFKANAEISRTQTLFRPYEGASVALFGLVAGQVSDSVLPPAEKFFLGGLRYNRGYYSGEVTGDNALVFSTEIQFNTSFSLQAFGMPVDLGMQYYGFYDYGETWENQKLDPNRHLSSAGIGVRTTVTQYTEFDVEGVERFTREPQDSLSTVSPLKGQALYWRVLARF